MSDTHKTHVNVFKQDVEKAHQAALGAVDNLKKCIDALEAKYHELLAELGPQGQAAAQDAATPPADEPKAKKSGKKPEEGDDTDE